MVVYERLVFWTISEVYAFINPYRRANVNCLVFKLTTSWFQVNIFSLNYSILIVQQVTNFVIFIRNASFHEKFSSINLKNVYKWILSQMEIWRLNSLITLRIEIVLLAHHNAPFESSAWMLFLRSTCLKSEIFNSLMYVELCGCISSSGIGSRANNLALSAIIIHHKRFVRIAANSCCE